MRPKLNKLEHVGLAGGGYNEIKLNAGPFPCEQTQTRLKTLPPRNFVGRSVITTVTAKLLKQRRLWLCADQTHDGLNLLHFSSDLKEMMSSFRLIIIICLLSRLAKCH